MKPLAMTTRERRIITRSMTRNTWRMSRERVNAKFVSCCGKLECMS